MIGLGLVKKNSAHFTCGEFSNKWFKSHDSIPWVNAQEISVPFGEGITPKLIEGVDTICTTLNETSTGVQIDELPNVDSQTLLCVDDTSGGVQFPCDVSKCDVFFFSPQKVFASEGGLWVAIMSPKAIERAMGIEENKERYIPGIMKWKVAIENGSKAQTNNTPAVATIFLLNEQVKLMNSLGLKKVTDMAAAKANHIYSWAQDKTYLSPYIQEKKYRSQAVATIDIDDKISVDDLTKRLRETGAALDIEGYRKLGRNQLRISLFHNVTLENLKKLTGLISMAVESEL